MTRDPGLTNLTESDRTKMLEAVGLPDADALFSQIPERFRLKQPLSLPKALPEWELERLMRKRASENLDCRDAACFIGAGVYDHHVPAVIDAIAERGEFLTAYTPYQPEMSQGLLQALEVFTSKMTAATGLPVVTSSHYDGATALAEACWMAVKATGRNAVAVSPMLSPQYRSVLETYCWGRSVELRWLSADAETGRVQPEIHKGEDLAAVVLQSPNGVGIIEDHREIAGVAQECGAKLISLQHPFLPFFLDERAADVCDILVMEGQPLGLHMFAGGAHLGILACTEELRRWTPGRLIGKVSDIYGRPALALVFEDREQHVARDRATSNICSNQALNALRAGAYLSLHGGAGLVGFSDACHRYASALRAGLLALDGVEAAYAGPFFNEFVVRLEDADRIAVVTDALRSQKIFAGATAAQTALLSDRELMIAATETKTRSDIENYLFIAAQALAVDADQALAAASAALDAGAQREPSRLAAHPSLQPSSELSLVRAYTAYSRNNFGVDTGSYPLGSCTMKHNPKRNDAVAEQTGFRALHPLQPVDTLSGLAQLYSELKSYIAELIGMAAVDLTPAAGAHGELKGLLIARRYFEELGQRQRCEVLVPDSAHGTNPASATMVGFKCRIIPTRQDGLMDVDACREMLSERTAVVMTTNPSTFGVFEEEIGDLIDAAHDVGALLYYDGANMNALMGRTTPGLMGFDIAHINVHKTLSTPHGGGGPGAGPIGVKAPLARYLSPGLDAPSAADPLRIKLHFGHISVLLRAYAYIRSMGPDGLREATTDAVLNANYLMRRLEPVLPPVFNRVCMHEALLDGRNLPITTLDLAKRMIDYEVHPPTLVGAGCVYYGEDLSQAMLFEPTESETKAELDALVDIIASIIEEGHQDSSVAASAPLSGKVARLVV